jgi:NitT/TauT family transport system substrate-binding protein
MLNVPVYTADVLGHFSDQKITPEILVFKTGGATALAAVLGGNANVYIGAPSSALNATNRGADVIAFGAILTEVALDIVVHKAAAEKVGLRREMPVIERFRALKGLKIGVTGAGSATHQVAQYALRAAGLDPERDATIVFVNSNEDMRAAFMSKRIDAVITASPTTDELKRDGSFLLADGAAGAYSALKGMAHIVLIGTRRWTSAAPDRTRRLLTAIAAAERDIHDPMISSKARDLVQAKYFPQLDKDLFDAAWTHVKQAIPRTPKLEADAMQRNIAFLREFSDQRYTVTPDKTYTNDYLPNRE